MMNHRKWVGPPAKYDILGALQFKIVTDMGLREHHKLLDIGCGSLRAGRFFIMYLLPGNYYGIDPESWVIEEGITREVSHELAELKKINLNCNGDFDLSVFKTKFDYIIAQSIFSHASPSQVAKCMSDIPKVLKKDGLFIATYKKGKVNNIDKTWTYPGCVTYTPRFFEKLSNRNGLRCDSMSYEHPNGQSWVMFSKKD